MIFMGQSHKYDQLLGRACIRLLEMAYLLMLSLSKIFPHGYRSRYTKERTPPEIKCVVFPKPGLCTGWAGLRWPWAYRHLVASRDQSSHAIVSVFAHTSQAWLSTAIPSAVFFFFFLHIVVARSAARDEGHDWMASAQILSDNMDRRVAGQVLIS